MAEVPQDSQPQRIAGYAVEGMLGAGGTSRVYLARQEALQRRVALKVFQVQAGAGANTAGRLAREARLLARLDHENIVRCYDFGQEGELFYLAMELVEGESLKQRLDREGRLGEDAAVALVTAVARALLHAHAQGIVHRDVKPGNVLLARDGRVKLTDFGLARGGEDLELTQPGTMIATPQYLSPEQVRNPRRADERSDLYSLGACLYHMVTGVTPHRGETLAEVIGGIVFGRVPPPETHCPGLSQPLSRVIARLMARERGRRYQSARELLEELGRLRAPAGEPPGISWEEAMPRGAPRRRVAWLPWAGGVAVLAALCLLGWLLWGRAAREDAAPEPAPPSAAFELADLTTGRLTAVEAWARIQEHAQAEGLRQAVLAEVARRAERVALRCTSAARRAVGEGRFEDALAEFDAELEAQARVSLGAPPAGLAPPLARLLEEEAATARQRALEELVSPARRRADEAIELDLDREFGEVTEMLGRREYRAALARLAQAETAAEEVVTRLFGSGLRSVVPEARDPRPPPSWLGEAAHSYRAALAKIRGRVTRTVDDARDHALRALESFALAQDQGAPSREEIVAQLRAAAEEALAIPLEDFPGEPGALDETVLRRAQEICAESAEQETARRSAAEAGVLALLAEALPRRDAAAATAALRSLPEGSDCLDPWLGLLVEQAPLLEQVEEQALSAFERSAGQKIGVAVRGITREGVLARVDRGRRVLEFEVPAFSVALADLEARDIVARAGASAHPAAAAVLLFYAGDLDGAEALAGENAAQPWSETMRGAVAARRAELQRIEAGLESFAADLLARFDQAVAEARTAEAVELAESVLRDAALRRLDLVERRAKELQRAAEQGRERLKVEEKRAVFRQKTGAEVVFGEDGAAELVYRFDSSREIDDFKLPGREWSVRGGRLTSVPAAGSPKEARADLFVNRPGVMRPIPFDPAQPVRLRFDLELPYEEPTPALFGVRLFSVCFVVRSFEPGTSPGQANAWRGDLDDFAGHVFEPSLGETRPTKKGAGAVREFALERGNRYRVVVDWAPGSPTWCLLSVDENVVYKYRIAEKPQVSSLEIRSRTAITIDELVLSGTLTGAGWSLK